MSIVQTKQINKLILALKGSNDQEPSLTLDEQKDGLKFTKIGIIASVILGLASLGLAYNAMESSVKIDKMDSLIGLMAKQIQQQDSEINQLNKLEKTSVETSSKISEQLSETKNQSQKISSQLIISQQELKNQNNTSLLSRRASLVRLNNLYKELWPINHWYNNKYFRDSANELEFVGYVKNFIEPDNENPIMLEDDSLSYKWILIYDDLKRTEDELKWKDFYETRFENGKEIIDKSYEAMKRFKQNRFEGFIKRYNDFFFCFLNFLKIKDREVGLRFEVHFDKSDF